MIYLLPLSHKDIIKRFPMEGFGMLINPKWVTVPPGVRNEGRIWALDNGAFNNRFNPTKFNAALERLKPYREKCLFIVAPDVLADSTETRRLWDEWAPRLEGWPLAFVAQDGQTPEQMPDCDWLFVGGTTEYKLGPDARSLIAWSRARDIRVHVGRVNTWRRMRYFKMLGVETMDGTLLCYGIDTHKQKVCDWVGILRAQGMLFEEGGG